MPTNTNAYAQMDKNTVSARGQLKESGSVKFDFPNAGGTRVMLVGNSITLHGISHEIGWHNEWGMAASAKEKDYVHLLEQAVLALDPQAAFCICQVSDWERLYKNAAETYPLYEQARLFAPDVIVFRCIENCPREGFDSAAFSAALDELLRYLDADRHARVIFTTGFWRHPGDGALCAYAQAQGYPCVQLGDLGEDDAMKAIGLFAHEGVANHPGDPGMQAIAARIAQHLLPTVRALRAHAE